MISFCVYANRQGPGRSDEYESAWETKVACHHRSAATGGRVDRFQYGNKAITEDRLSAADRYFAAKNTRRIRQSASRAEDT